MRKKTNFGEHIVEIVVEFKEWRFDLDVDNYLSIVYEDGFYHISKIFEEDSFFNESHHSYLGKTPFVEDVETLISIIEKLNGWW